MKLGKLASLRPALRGWKSTYDPNEIVRKVKSPTRLEGMEMRQRARVMLCAHWSPTRLEGMETNESEYGR